MNRNPFSAPLVDPKPAPAAASRPHHGIGLLFLTCGCLAFGITSVLTHLAGLSSLLWPTVAFTSIAFAPNLILYCCRISSMLTMTLTLILEIGLISTWLVTS